MEDEVYDIIDDPSFWRAAETLVKVAWPLMMLLRLGDMRKPTLHLVYKAALIVQERLEKHIEGDDTLSHEYAASFNDAFDDYLLDLTSDIAMAASWDVPGRCPLGVSHEIRRALPRYSLKPGGSPGLATRAALASALHCRVASHSHRKWLRSAEHLPPQSGQYHCLSDVSTHDPSAAAQAHSVA